MGELESLSMNVSSDKFEGNKSELEERYGRFRTHHEIIRKVQTHIFIIPYMVLHVILRSLRQPSNYGIRYQIVLQHLLS